MKKIFFCLTAVVLLYHPLKGQNKAHLQLIGAAIGDSIVLRWAVANPDGWMKASVSGYILERTTLDKKNQVVGKVSERLRSDTIHPWSFSKLEMQMDRKDTFAIIAAQCLYGKTMRTAQSENNFIEALKQADEESVNRHGYAAMSADFSAHAADILGWRLVDQNIRKDRKYVYTLRCPMLNGRIWADTAIFVVNPAEFQPLQPMMPPTLLSAEKQVVISWKRQDYLTAYYIERSSDGEHFVRLNKTPFMDWTAPGKVKSDSLVWNDSVGVNYQPFYYRISGINPFAQITPPSFPVKGYGADRTPPLSPLIMKGENKSTGKVNLEWELPPISEPLSGIIVARTSDPAMPYHTLSDGLLPPTTIAFTDENAWQFGTNYYVVGLVDTAGNIGWSPLYYAVMADFDPPVRPVGLSGSIDTSGRVSLSWKLGPDFDLKGYQVLVANQADHDFIPLADSIIEDTVFQYNIDLRNLTEHIFYRVQAFDKNLKASEPSAMLELKKPDVIAPDAPVFDDYKVSENRVYLHWRPSSAKDAASQLLLRRAKDHPWEVFVKLPVNTVSFDDTLLTAGQYWEYAIQAEDDAGLRSGPSFPVAVKIPASTKKKAVSGFTAVWDAEKNRVQLEWKVNADHVLIYRALNDGGLEMFARVAGNSITYFDSPQRKGKYTYAIKPFYADGSEGILSETVAVTTH